MLRYCDQLHLRLPSHGTDAVDVTRLFLDSRGGIAALSRSALTLHAGRHVTIPIQIATLHPRTAGNEHRARDERAGIRRLMERAGDTDRRHRDILARQIALVELPSPRDTGEDDGAEDRAVGLLVHYRAPPRRAAPCRPARREPAAPRVPPAWPPPSLTRRSVPSLGSCRTGDPPLAFSPRRVACARPRPRPSAPGRRARSRDPSWRRTRRPPAR